MGGSGLMCANESAIVDGNHDPKAGYGTASPPCFFWAPDEALGRWRNGLWPRRRRRLLRTGRSCPMSKGSISRGSGSTSGFTKSMWTWPGAAGGGRPRGYFSKGQEREPPRTLFR